VDERKKNIGREAHSCAEEALQVADVASPTKQGSRCKTCWSDSKGNIETNQAKGRVHYALLLDISV
jgi:hypothetical protein